MTLACRIIPCLDVDAGRVVKGIEFEGLRDMGDPARDLLGVMGDENERWSSRIGGEGRQTRQEALPRRQVEPGGGLVEEQQLGVGDQCPGKKHLLSLPL